MAKHTTGWSNRVRDLARRDYVDPVRGEAAVVRIPFGELKAKLVRIGFPQSHANQVATPLESAKFWKPLGLELVSQKGQARTVNSVLEFRFADDSSAQSGEVPETKKERDRKSMQAVDELRGLLKKEIDVFGGAEAFIRWVRSDKDEDAA